VDNFFDETGNRTNGRSERLKRSHDRSEALLTSAIYFFAFCPNCTGRDDPYLDPEAVPKQQTLISSVAARFTKCHAHLGFDQRAAHLTDCGQFEPTKTGLISKKMNEWLAKK